MDARVGATSSSQKNSFPRPSNQITDAAHQTSTSEKDEEEHSDLQNHGHLPGQAPRHIKGYTWAIVVTGVLFSEFLFALDNTIVADIQPRIVEDLGETTKLPWITVAFELGCVSANLLWGRLFALFDHKALFITAVILFEIGSAICGAAPTMNALIVGRLICGLGSNGIYLGALNIVSALTSLQERPVYLSYIGITWGVGTVLGPVIGGAFADSQAGWRWSFYINLCIGGLVAPIYLFLLPSYSAMAHESILNRIRQIDLIGLILFVGAFVSTTMAISFGGTLYDWSNSRIIALFCCTAVLWILSAAQQATKLFTSSQSRLFPAHFLRSGTMWNLFFQTAAAGSALLLPIYFIPLYFQFAEADSALTAAVRLLPFICFAVFFCLLNGAFMGRTGFYMPWYVCGNALVLVGTALMSTVNLNTDHAKVYGYSILISAGVGCYAQASFPVAQAKVQPAEVPLAVSFIACAQLSGLTISFAVANSIFLNQGLGRIRLLLPDEPKSVVQAAISGVSGQVLTDTPREERREILEAISASIADVYYLLLATAALALLLSLLLKREKLFLG